MRIACFYVPLFPLAARLRSEPELLQEAVVITEGHGHHAHVVAAARAARKKGILPGLSLPQARAILPKIIVRAREEPCERTAQEALLEVAETFSPRVEDAGDGVVYFDITGMERHFADSDQPAWEKRLGQAAVRAAETIGLPAWVGIAGSKLAARIAAEVPSTPTIVTPGEETSFLAPLPLARLSPELEAAAMLQRWGLSSIGELAQLGESDVASRLGELGRQLHRAAHGIDPRPLIPRAMPEEFREAMEMEWPIITLEPFLLFVQAALERLTTRMEIQGFACKRLEITLTLESDGYHSRAIELPAPTRDVKTLLTLLRLDLEKTQPGAPVVGFSLVAHPDRPRRAQLSLFGPPALSPEKLATTIARLVSMLGEGRVGMPRTVDGHLPERAALGDYAPPPPPETRREPQKGRPLMAMRVFRPPIPLEVILRPSREDEPGDVQIESIRAEDPKVPIAGSVRLSSGPWQIEEGWWQQAPADREYWEVEMIHGGIYRVYRAKGEEKWYSDGVCGDGYKG